MGRLDGKIALISGTGRGMGRAAALEFAAQGAAVFGCDLNEPESAGTVALVRNAGGVMEAAAPLDLSTADGARVRTPPDVPMRPALTCAASGTTRWSTPRRHCAIWSRPLVPTRLSSAPTTPSTWAWPTRSSGPPRPGFPPRT